VEHEVSPDVKLVNGRLLDGHSDRSLGDLTFCNAFIFSRVAERGEAVNPVSVYARLGRVRAVDNCVWRYKRDADHSLERAKRVHLIRSL
jgi:hypothetical protein